MCSSPNDRKNVNKCWQPSPSQSAQPPLRGRRAFAVATRKEWAAFRAAKRSAKPVATKKAPPKKAPAKCAVKPVGRASRWRSPCDYRVSQQ